jgi:hypothetical protein
MGNTAVRNGKRAGAAMWQISPVHAEEDRVRRVEQAQAFGGPIRRALALSVVVWLCAGPSAARAQGARDAARAGERGWSSATFVELSASFVPVANDVPLMLGFGVQVGRVHEVWARVGYIPVGDDGGHGFGVVGYRAALRPGRVLRPVLGGYLAALPASCGHDAQGRPSCTPDRLYIVSSTGGIRIEPAPWVGFSALLSLGVDSYPNPFGMVELAVMFALPLS